MLDHMDAVDALLERLRVTFADARPGAELAGASGV
jgi:hypothetical protein